MYTCRSFLTPDRSGNGWNNISKALDYNGSRKYYGRTNLGVCTLNLVDIALSSEGDIETFWKLFDERTELCHQVLQIRVKKLSNAVSDVAPILWQNGALARLEPGEKLDKLVHNGYMTASLGYVGIYEMTKVMTGKSHTEPEGKEFALRVMQALNDKCNQWKHEENVDYSLYGTPIESTTYKFAKKLRSKFGVIKGITDRDFVTNSYHVFVEEEINPFDKIDIESEYQALSPGGAISYLEAENLETNLEALLEIIKYIYDHIMYCEINSKIDCCQKCGSRKEFEIVGEQGHLHFRCSNCGNEDKDTLNACRRVCGYISTDTPNSGRMDEIRNRVVHLTDKNV